MVREFKLPDVGEGVAEGEIVSWLVDVGDQVEEDQPVAEVETDKALVEVPAPVTGTVRELRAEPGEVVPVGEVFITFDVEGEGAEGAADEAGEPEGTGDGTGAGEVREEPPDTGEEASGAGTPEAGGAERDGARVFAAPSVRRLARELGVDLSTVEGSDPGGRVTERDVRAAAGGGAEADSAAGASETPDVTEEAAPAGGGEPAGTGAAASAGAGAPAARDRTLAAPATRRLAEELGVDLDAVPASEQRDGEAFVTADAVRGFAETGGKVEAEGAAGAAAGAEPTGGEERVPYRGLRRSIGEQMERSAYTAPHVTHHDLLDAKPLVEGREALKPLAEERGLRLTYLPFVMKAATAALAEYPSLNATLDEEAEEIVLKRYYNLGFATATEGGLLVPVVEGADRKDLFELAAEVTELAEKARDRSISRAEMRGGTFTITNFGAVGGEYGTPIINYPEVAILGLGAIEKRPYVVDGSVEARETLPLSLSFDHRVIDGATSGRFTNRLIEHLEQPMRLLVD